MTDLDEERDAALIADWYKERPKTPGELQRFVRELLTEYKHDYGTICHALAAAAVAAARTVDADPDQGGITGFQASAVMWEFVKNWTGKTGPFRLVDFSDMLYPKRGYKFNRSITAAEWEWLQSKAKEQLAEMGYEPTGDVTAHLRSIVNGIVPFGYTVEATK
jgi:hypothetical protein